MQWLLIVHSKPQTIQKASCSSVFAWPWLSVERANWKNQLSGNINWSLLVNNLRGAMRAKTIKNSQQCQNKINQQRSRISSLEAQNQLFKPKILINAITQAVASNLNISTGNKPNGSNSGLGYISKPYLRKPQSPQLTLAIDGSLNPELTCWHCKDTGHLKENCIKLNQWLALEQTDVEKKMASNNNAMTTADQLSKPSENWTLL